MNRTDGLPGVSGAVRQAFEVLGPEATTEAIEAFIKARYPNARVHRGTVASCASAHRGSAYRRMGASDLRIKARNRTTLVQGENAVDLLTLLAGVEELANMVGGLHRLAELLQAIMGMSSRFESPPPRAI